MMETIERAGVGVDAGAARPVVVARTRGDRFFLAVAIVCAIVVFIGFSRTYYLSSVLSSELETSRPLTLMTHIHGAVMTLWFTLFAIQTALIPAGRTDVHRRLGVLGVLIICTIIPLGVIAAVRAAARGFTPGPNGPPPLMFMTIPIFDMIVFGVLAGAGIANRRRPDVHKRLMALSCLGILTPAIARFPMIDKLGPPAFLGMTDVILLTFVWIDTIRNKRLHPAFGWGALLIVLSQPLRFAVAMTPAWNAFAKWATGLVG